MFKKRIAVLVAFVVVLGSILAGCGNSKSSGTSTKKSAFKAGMVTDTGGVDDKSFNQSAWEGLTTYAKDNDLKKGTDVKYLQSTQPSDYSPNLNTMVHQNFNIVYGIGFLMQSDIQKVAEQNPKAQLGIIDAVAVDKNNKPLKNVASITFKEEQGSFLVGVVAGLTTKTNKVGFIGGINSALIKKFENGFKAGVKAVNPDAEVYAQYAGAFDAPDKGRAIAQTLYTKGADIIYASAGNTGNGVFTEAKNRAKNGKKVWVIGVDKDQHDQGMPENVTLTSMVKRVDKAIYDVTKQTKAGDFPGGQVLSFGLKENGVGIAPTTENVSKKALDEVNQYKSKIIDGSIKVPTTDKEFKEYAATLK
ncbi:BMP family lipoprotein [Sporolactobacillus terrae]|uniref:BMP family ABC transporter substrate-binding protein n=1 Tax=Sporolactobacillus terrae TaxID=269673 RepID=A0A410DBY7_9BACL|nr:BMP family ABC transporter substrate-binding protein [Sporolactobacillus terrae]QAA23637.1 BMP family ABC transporter substrate-binding protein [Sporolactobacillus terrae]QAA26607.1 BMP family ABC transporter substrate-binding protein [Sporolactobacillus terrae]UAK15678.1 BMP family ABC transporter substrate-binding protein [Sporolactobacillus terrae]BBO00147.1 BMP family ABC transporter substrate-binding protein [Sporolactobacillus terrae]